MDICKSLNINIGTVMKNPEMLKFVPAHLETNKQVWVVARQHYNRKDHFGQIFFLSFSSMTTHMTSMKIVQFSRPPTPLSIYVQNSFTPFTLDAQLKMNPTPCTHTHTHPLQIITNHLKENIIHEWLLCYHVLPSGRLSFSLSTH